VAVQEIRWDTEYTKPAGEYIFFYGIGNENHELCIVFYFVHKIITSVVQRVGFSVTDVAHNTRRSLV
jgi:hypothetical protein